MARKLNVAIVGATGVVGSIMRRLIADERGNWGEVRLVASARSAGKILSVGDEDIEVQAISADVFDGIDIAHFDLPDEVSAEWVPVAAAKGVVVIDKSGYFRMDPDVPLVCREANPEAAAVRPKGIIANANCTTLALIPSLAALNEACRGVGQIVSTVNNNMGSGATSPTKVDLTAHQNLCAAARNAGVRRLMYVSARGVDQDSPVDIFRIKWYIEDAIRRSGVRYVFLRPSAFMEIWVDQIIAGGIRRKGVTTIFGDGSRAQSASARSVMNCRRSISWSPRNRRAIRRQSPSTNSSRNMPTPSPPSTAARTTRR